MAGFSSGGGSGRPSASPAKTWISQIGRAISRGLCGLRGHDEIPQFERNRIFLVCATCGRETPGWNVAPACRRPTVPTAMPSWPTSLQLARKG